MQSLESFAATAANELEHEPSRATRAAPIADRRSAVALLRWVASCGLDGGTLSCGWELGVHGQRGTDGVGGLLDRVSAAELAVWGSVERIRRSSELSAEQALALHARLRGAVRMLTRTALKGFIVGREQAHRRWLRELRHDLRNPIGAIKNALALLEETAGGDGSVERLCGIATRNSSALESMVRSRAADEADRGAVEWAGRAPAAGVVERVVAEIGDTAPAALRRLAAPRRVPPVTVDALALEIALHALLRHALGSAGVVSVSGAHDRTRTSAGRVQVRLSTGPVPGDRAPASDEPQRSDRPSPDLLALARAVAGAVDGEVTGALDSDEGLTLSLPALAEWDEGHDLARTGKRQDRHPRQL